ncbi:hypothetical protein P9112_008226 [Eukaryota sp. TZLM1-RC]
MQHYQQNFIKGIDLIQSSFNHLTDSFSDQNSKLQEENQALRNRIADLEKELSVYQHKYSTLRTKIAQLSDEKVDDDRYRESHLSPTFSTQPLNELQGLLAQDVVRESGIGMRTSPTASPYRYPQTGDQVDPKRFYKDVKEVLSRDQFTKFASAIRSYNNQELTGTEILDIIQALNLPSVLYQQFVRLLAQTR